MIFRIGHGFDVHALGPGDAVVLGGVRIPFRQGIVAHSDGDVLLHALCDALLGAAALGDIGRHFPDNDPAYVDIDSRVLLRQVYMLLQARSYVIQNIDITMIAQAPKLAPYIETMCANLAEDLELHIEQVNIKATTTEKLGAIGRGEGIAAHAVALLTKAS